MFAPAWAQAPPLVTAGQLPLFARWRSWNPRRKTLSACPWVRELSPCSLPESRRCPSSCLCFYVLCPSSQALAMACAGRSEPPGDREGPRAVLALGEVWGHSRTPAQATAAQIWAWWCRQQGKNPGKCPRTGSRSSVFYEEKLGLQMNGLAMEAINYTARTLTTW